MYIKIIKNEEQPLLRVPCLHCRHKLIEIVLKHFVGSPTFIKKSDVFNFFHRNSGCTCEIMC